MTVKKRWLNLQVLERRTLPWLMAAEAESSQTLWNRLVWSLMKLDIVSSIRKIQGCSLISSTAVTIKKARTQWFSPATSSPLSGSRTSMKTTHCSVQWIESLMMPWFSTYAVTVTAGRNVNLIPWQLSGEKRQTPYYRQQTKLSSKRLSFWLFLLN